MKYAINLVFLLLFGCKTTLEIAVPVSDIKQAEVDFTTEQLQLITSTLSQFPNESEMAIAILQDGQTTFLGLKRNGDTIRVVPNARRVFEVGSITKVFTTQLLLHAYADQLIKDLDEPIRAYSPYAIKGDPNITFRQLANHTAGLPSSLSSSIFTTKPSNPYRDWDEERLRKFLENKVRLSSPPGSQYQYSNIGMAILANTVCHLRKTSYEALLQEEIFAPLQMTSTTTDRLAVQKSLVQAYNWRGEATDNWDLAAIAGAGAVLSTVEDLSRYLNWCFDALDNELALMSQPSQSIDDVLSVALGWHMIKGYTPSPFLWHNGGTGGYKAAMGLNRSNRTGLIILSNVGAVNNPKRGLIDKLSYELMKTLN